MRARLAAALLLLSLPAHAQLLPCGGEPQVHPSIRFMAPADAAEAQVSGYRLYAAAEGQREESIDLENLDLETVGQGLYETTAPFDSTRSYRLTMTAIGPGGESARSNELVLAATSRGACPRPGAPRLIEVVIEIDGRRVTLPVPKP